MASSNDFSNRNLKILSRISPWRDRPRKRWIIPDIGNSICTLQVVTRNDPSKHVRMLNCLSRGRQARQINLYRCHEIVTRIRGGVHTFSPSPPMCSGGVKLWGVVHGNRKVENFEIRIRRVTAIDYRARFDMASSRSQAERLLRIST